MAVAAAHDDLFTRAVSGYRDVFWNEHQHLSESERNRLWKQRLSQFITNEHASASKELSTGIIPSPETLGKRTRQGAPRNLADTPSSAKRRATNTDPSGATALTRSGTSTTANNTSSVASSSNVPNRQPSTTKKTRIGNSSASRGPLTGTVPMARSQSQQMLSTKQQRPAIQETRRQSAESAIYKHKLAHLNVHEYSPSEYTEQCVEDVSGQGTPTFALSISPDIDMAVASQGSINTQQQQQHQNKPPTQSFHNGQMQHPFSLSGAAQASDQLTVAAMQATEMSRSTTTDRKSVV